MTPRRIVAPVGAVVSLPELKAHLRVDGDDDDTLITSLEQSAVAHLDGWRGVLGRCIQEQTWQVDYPAAGLFRLPFPDVTEVEASAGTATLSHDSLGSRVTLTEAATVTLTAAMPEEAMAAVRLIIKLLVGHWYEHREGSTASALRDAPLAVDTLLSPLRWRQL